MSFVERVTSKGFDDGAKPRYRGLLDWNLAGR